MFDANIVVLFSYFVISRVFYLFSSPVYSIIGRFNFDVFVVRILFCSFNSPTTIHYDFWTSITSYLLSYDDDELIRLQQPNDEKWKYAEKNENENEEDVNDSIFERMSISYLQY